MKKIFLLFPVFIMFLLLLIVIAIPEKHDLEENAYLESESILESASESIPEAISEPEEPLSSDKNVEVVNVENAFYCIELDDDIKNRITGISYPDTEEPIQISYSELRYVGILYYDFDGNVQPGELICNEAIADKLVNIFKELYDNQYQIESVKLVDEFGGDDEASMAANNSSCFNYRTIAGTTKISNHSYGLAIDINPRYNPYITYHDGEALIQPSNGIEYADREADFEHKITEDDLCYQLFIQNGFTWGGAWKNSKDYQHFEYKKERE